MTNSNSLKITIQEPFFKLSRYLLGLGWQRATITIVFCALGIVGVGLFLAESDGRNYLLDGYYALGQWLESHSSPSASSKLNILAFLYVIATVFFFIINLFVLPVLSRIGLSIVDQTSRIYSELDRINFCDSVKEEFENPRHSVSFIVGLTVIFFVGELGEIYRQWHLSGAWRWSGLFVGYLLVVPVCMNGIMVGTEASLVFSLIKTVRKHMPPLPAKLYDDGYAGLAPVGGFICFLSLIWFLAMLLLTPLFYLSGGPGVWMFIALGLIGVTLFSVPLYAFHKKLQDRKIRVMTIYANALNRCLERYSARPHAQRFEQVKMLQECYARAERLKVWLPLFGPSIGLQVLSVIWTVVNEPVIKQIRGVIEKWQG